MNDTEIILFREAVSRFLEREAPPSRVEAWREAGMVERAFWTKAGEAGFLGASLPAEFGGGGGDVRHDVVLIEEAVRHDVSGFAISLHNGVVAPYIAAHGTIEQKQRWIPKLSNGELIAALALSEPGMGSDLKTMRTTAKKEGDHYVISGQKTFITNGQIADFIVVAASTDLTLRSRGISLFVVETATVEGFSRGRKLRKIGNPAQDTSELFFDDVRIPATNLLGEKEGDGFRQLMCELPKERLMIAAQSLVMAEVAVAETIEYTKSRKLFDQTLFDFQNTRFKLAETKANISVGRAFFDECLLELLHSGLTNQKAAIAKYWLTHMQNRVIDECLQLHGGYGYMEDYRIGRMFKDARVSRIYGGANEVMKEVIARSL